VPTQLGYRHSSAETIFADGDNHRTSSSHDAYSIPNTVSCSFPLVPTPSPPRTVEFPFQSVNDDEKVTGVFIRPSFISSAAYQRRLADSDQSRSGGLYWPRTSVRGLFTHFSI